MVPINLTIVVARPGARGDFVAGWLGTLPGFVDSQWRIDIPTGRSFGLMNCLKDIDSVDYGSNTLNYLLGYRNYTLGDSNWTFAVSCHGYGLANKISKSTNIKVIQITTDVQDNVVINWEYIVKTYFCQERFESSLHQNKFYNIDNCDLLEHQLLIKNYANAARYSNDLDLELECIQINYKDLFCPGGSYCLCEKLDIEPDIDYHRYWDLQLSIASSKLSYQMFEKNWTIDNYWK